MKCFFSNYRPVSLLPVFSKVLERLMYNRLITYINQNHLLYNLQFGFQEGKSTHIALITLIDKISEALDNSDIVIGVFLDFARLLILLITVFFFKKLHIYGIRGLALQWFDSYLSSRVQYVTYNSIKSEREIIKCCIPQGSILGPLFFLIYINDLATVSRNSLPILFADDTNIFSTGKNLSELSESLNEALVNIEEWLRCNRLSLNVLKTNYMIFTTKNKLNHNVDISVNNVLIERVYVTKFLGVQIDPKLNWKNHIEYICKKISKCIRMISKARRKLHKSPLIPLYYSFAFPYFIYCNHVWGNTYKTNLESIARVQKKLVRLITCSSYRAHTEPLMAANNLLSITDINVCIYDMYFCVPMAVWQYT